MELHSNVKVQRAISPIAAGTTGTGKTSVIIDRQGYAGLEFVFDYGTLTATNAVVNVVAKHGDVTGSLASIADTDLVGLESAASLPQAVRTSGIGKNVSKKLGYRGNKRYLTVQMINTVTAAIPIAATVLLFKAELAPVT